MSIVDPAPERAVRFIDRFLVVPPATRNGGVPAQGWARVAMAVSGLRRDEEALVVVETTDSGRIIVDWARKHFWWLTPPATFPIDPMVTSVRMLRGPEARMPFVQDQPGALSTLLWTMGIHSFAGAPAWWLLDGSRYRLTRWPNLTALDHDPDQVRMVAMLAADAMTPGELARVAGVEPRAAQKLVNALSLMGLTSEQPEAPGVPPVMSAPAEVAPARTSIFSRLRARLAG